MISSVVEGQEPRKILPSSAATTKELVDMVSAVEYLQ
jgi:hypothetical protein